jgi:hypothetical protein
MKRQYLFVLGSVAAFCAAVPANAEGTAADAPRLAAASKLLEAMHYDTLIDRTLDAIVAESQRAIAANLNQSADEPLPASLVTKIQGIVEIHIRQAIGDHRAELKRGTALIYARLFTTEELGRLAHLQADPVMAKMQAETPAIAAETMALSSGLAANARGKVEEEVKAAVVEYLQTKDGKPAT